MRFIIDTQIWIWWFTDSARISADARRLIEDPKSTVLLSAVCAWEISIKYALGKLKLPKAPDEFIPQTLAECQFSSLEIHTLHALQTGSLPHHHHDPFDRMLIAQAQFERIPIMTVDPIFKRYDVKLIPC